MSFDKDTFLNNVQELSGEFSTTLTPVPPGEYPATIKAVDCGQMTENGGVPFNVVWEVDDAGAKEITGRNNITVRQTVWLDIGSDGKSLDRSKGKNIGLGRLLEALGMNKAGAWAPSMLQGKAARVRVANRPDKNDPSVIYDNVTAVTSL